MHPALIWGGGFSAVAYGYATGRLSNFLESLKTNGNANSPQSPEQLVQHSAPKQQPMIVVQSGNGKTSYVMPLSAACLIGLGGYYYYIHSHGTKKVIRKVKQTAQETQDLVQKTDENNSQRFEALDEKNQCRANEVELQIRTEQRAGLAVISQQLYCLTQVAVQTLSAVATSAQMADTNEGNGSMNQEKLLGYCDKAQEMADTILEEDNLLKSKERNLSDIKAEIELRGNQRHQIFSNATAADVTPGGPLPEGDMVYENETMRLLDVDVTPNGTEQLKEQSQKAVQYMYNNRQYIVLASGICLSLYMGNKLIDTILQRNQVQPGRNKTRQMS